jgi:CRP/FNR family transcriptional regulator
VLDANAMVTADGQGESARQELAERVRSLLAPFLHPRTFAPGELLWREGDDAGMLACIDSGRVKIHRVLPNGEDLTLFLFGPGDAFGFMPFLDGRPYPATAQALTEVTALVMARSQLVGAFERDPQVALTLVGLLATRLREAFDRIERSSTPAVLPRVAAALASLLPPGGGTSSLVVVELPVRGGGRDRPGELLARGDGAREAADPPPPRPPSVPDPRSGRAPRDGRALQRRPVIMSAPQLVSEATRPLAAAHKRRALPVVNGSAEIPSYVHPSRACRA